MQASVYIWQHRQHTHQPLARPHRQSNSLGDHDIRKIINLKSIHKQESKINNGLNDLNTQPQARCYHILQPKAK